MKARPSRDLIITGHQQVTHEWWQTSRHDFAVVSSQLVIREAGAGDSESAQERLTLLGKLTLLEITEEALALAQHILRTGAIPVGFPEDALHVAVAAVNGIEYLPTWNCTPLANAGMRGKIEAACREFGYEAVIICTPEELMEA